MQNSKKVNKKLLSAAIVTLIFNIVFFLTIWLLNKYDQIFLDQILFQIKSPANGTGGGIVSSAVLIIGGLTILLTGVEFTAFYILGGFANKWFKKSEKYLNYQKSDICRFFKKTALPFSIATAVFATSFFVFKLKIPSYIITTSTESSFIEENYIKPTNDILSFPSTKRNLIYIYLESMENTYMSTADGGAMETDFIPELTALAKEHTSFSNTNTLGGALSFSGTTWTSGALVAQTSGVPVKVPINAEPYGGSSTFVDGVISLGEVLEENGYNQTLLIGSDAVFGGRDVYFRDNGNYNIVDFNSLKAEGRLDEDYSVWWGYEDEKLFSYAKEELEKLSSQDKPFNFTLLTADTHFPDGYVCRLCQTEHSEQYANVLSCSAKQIKAFLDWLKQQPYYHNTTIILSGDHLTMDPNFLTEIDQSYTRTVYNCFINSAVGAQSTKNRLFGTFDMFPTTLAAMGVNIKGERLGLGTNLFSGEKTLTEQYGFEMLNEEMQKKSPFYNENFLQLPSGPKKQ